MINQESLARIDLISLALKHTSNYMHGLEYARTTRPADTPDAIKHRLIDDECNEDLLNFNNMAEDIERDILATLPEDTHSYFREMQGAVAECIQRYKITAQD